MKNILNIFIALFLLNCPGISTAFSAGQTSPHTYKQTNSLNHDLVLVKPLVNFNDTNGGFYSDYYKEQVNNIYCGGVVKNSGLLSTTHVYLLVHILGYNNNVMATYTSDTIPLMAANETDTLKVQPFTNTGNWYNFKISFELMSDSTDENAANNIDTTATLTMWDPMWSHVSRANVPTATLNINNIPNFHSGDFIGATLKIPNYSFHWAVMLSVYLTDILPDSVTLVAEIYENGILKGSDTIISNTQGWVSTPLTYYYFTNQISTDSLYYFGVKIICPNGTNIPIGIDTSAFHNFQTETVAKIGNTWTTLNFVPLIQLVCDPEGIPEIPNNDLISVYPNPATNNLTIQTTRQATIEILNIEGQIIKRIETKEGKTNVDHVGWSSYVVDVSGFSKGIYMIRAQTDKGLWMGKFVKE